MIPRKTNSPPKPAVSIEPEPKKPPTHRHDPPKAKYLFTPKHHRKLAEFCAAHIKAAKHREQAWMMMYEMRDMLLADHHRNFQPTDFVMLVRSLVDEK